MATNRSRRSRKFKKSTISDSLNHYFLTGSYCAVEDCPDRAYTFLLARPGREPELRRLWDAVKDSVLSEWIKKFPCSRPWAWWKFDASEQRKHLSGSGGWEPGMAIDETGLPQYWQFTWNEDDPPFFESQAAYLDRHGLLTAPEQKHLKQNPQLLESEKIEFDD